MTVCLVLVTVPAPLEWWTTSCPPMCLYPAARTVRSMQRLQRSLSAAYGSTKRPHGLRWRKCACCTTLVWSSGRTRTCGAGTGYVTSAMVVLDSNVMLTESRTTGVPGGSLLPRSHAARSRCARYPCTSVDGNRASGACPVVVLAAELVVGPLLVWCRRHGFGAWLTTAVGLQHSTDWCEGSCGTFTLQYYPGVSAASLAQFNVVCACLALWNTSWAVVLTCACEQPYKYLTSEKVDTHDKAECFVATPNTYAFQGRISSDDEYELPGCELYLSQAVHSCLF